MHAATWRDGQLVAALIQYLPAGSAITERLRRAERIGRPIVVLMPGLDVKPLLEELRARVAEDRDDELEVAA